MPTSRWPLKLQKPMRALQGSKLRWWLRAGGNNLGADTMLLRLLRCCWAYHSCWAWGAQGSHELANIYTMVPRG